MEAASAEGVRAKGKRDAGKKKNKKKNNNRYYFGVDCFLFMNTIQIKHKMAIGSGSAV